MTRAELNRVKFKNVDLGECDFSQANNDKGKNEKCWPKQYGFCVLDSVCVSLELTRPCAMLSW